MTETTLIAHEHAARAFADALRLFTGHGRRFSVQALAAASGVRPRTVESYLCGQATPGWAAALSLAAVLPVEFLDAALLPTGRGAVDRAAIFWRRWPLSRPVSPRPWPTAASITASAPP